MHQSLVQSSPVHKILSQVDEGSEYGWEGIQFAPYLKYRGNGAKRVVNATTGFPFNEHGYLFHQLCTNQSLEMNFLKFSEVFDGLLQKFVEDLISRYSTPLPNGVTFLIISRKSLKVLYTLCRLIRQVSSNLICEQFSCWIKFGWASPRNESVR